METNFQSWSIFKGSENSSLSSLRLQDQGDDDDDDDGKCGVIQLLIINLHLFSRNEWYDDGRLLLIIVTLCIVLPLAMLPKIGKYIDQATS